MTGGPHTKLSSVTNAQDATVSNILLDNFINFYDWGFVDRGSFYNISIPQSGLYGGDRHKLRKSDDPQAGKSGRRIAKTGFGNPVLTEQHSSLL